MSATTRRPRPGETEGVAYHFLSEDEFERRVRAGDFVEHARYSGRRYGTLRSELDARIAGGRPVVLEIEVQGARQIREAMPEAVQIFIAPPSEEALRTRLVGRGTDDPDQIAARLATAQRGARRARRVRARRGQRPARRRVRRARGMRPRAPRPAVPEGGLTADHGSDLSPADEALLRGPPPARAIAWCERAAGARIVAVAPLRGGTSSAVHALTLRAAGASWCCAASCARTGWPRSRTRPRARSPRWRSRSAARCRRRGSWRPTRSGAEAGDSGRADDAAAGRRGLAPGGGRAVPRGPRGAAARDPRHAGRARRPARLRAVRARDPRAAAGGTRPRRLGRGVRAVRRPSRRPRPRCSSIATSTPATSLDGGAVTGLVDWASAAIGPAAADAGHCRWNLARTLGQDAADRFLALTGLPYHPYWDVVAALGGYDAAELAAKPPAEEAFLAAAVRRA